MTSVYLLEQDRAAFFKADVTRTPRLEDFAYAYLDGAEKLVKVAEVGSINPYGGIFTLGRIKSYGGLEAVRIKRTFGEPSGCFITPSQERQVRGSAVLFDDEKLALPLSAVDLIVYAFELYYGPTVNRNQVDGPLLIYRA